MPDWAFRAYALCCPTQPQRRDKALAGHHAPKPTCFARHVPAVGLDLAWMASAIPVGIGSHPGRDRDGGGGAEVRDLQGPDHRVCLRTRGATAEERLAMTNWQRHTLRGFFSHQLRGPVASQRVVGGLSAAPATTRSSAAVGLDPPIEQQFDGTRRTVATAAEFVRIARIRDPQLCSFSNLSTQIGNYCQTRGSS